MEERYFHSITYHNDDDDELTLCESCYDNLVSRDCYEHTHVGLTITAPGTIYCDRCDDETGNTLHEMGIV